MGPHVDVTAIAPWEVHNWEAHVSREGVMNPKSRKEYVDGLYSLLTNSSTVIIRLAGTISNKDRFDDKLVGGAAASVTEGLVGTRPGHTRTMSWCLGTEVTQYGFRGVGARKECEFGIRKSRLYNIQRRRSGCTRAGGRREGGSSCTGHAAGYG